MPHLCRPSCCGSKFARTFWSANHIFQFCEDMHSSNPRKHTKEQHLSAILVTSLPASVPQQHRHRYITWGLWIVLCINPGIYRFCGDLCKETQGRNIKSIFCTRQSSRTSLQHQCHLHMNVCGTFNDWENLLADLTGFTASVATCMTIWVDSDEPLMSIG